MKAGLLEEAAPDAGWGCCHSDPTPSTLHGDCCQDQPMFPQAGVPGLSVRASSDQNMTGSATLDPSQLTDPKL